MLRETRGFVKLSENPMRFDCVLSSLRVLEILVLRSLVLGYLPFVSFSLRLWTVEEKIQFEVIFKFFLCVVWFLKKAKYTIHNMKEICTCICMRGGCTTYI